MWCLGDQEFKSYIERLNGTETGVLQDPELMAMLLPILRADAQLDETYTHCPHYAPLACPITAFGGKLDAEVSTTELEGWKDVTQEPLDVQLFDGDHFFINTHSTAVVKRISQLFISSRQTPARDRWLVPGAKCDAERLPGRR